MRRLSETLARHGQLAVLMVLVAGGAWFQADFLTRLNLSSIAVQYSIIGLIALGQFAVMLTSGIDLSQGSLIAVGSILAAALSRSLGVPLAVGVALLTTSGLGLVNGLIVAFTRVPAFVVTLGMLGIARGLALTLTNSRPVPVRSEFVDLSRLRVLDVPIVFPLFLACALLLGAFLWFWPLGRHFYAVGGGEESARLSGVKVPAVKLTAYSLSGLLAGLAGLIITSRMRTGHPLTGTNYELESIAAAIIGGASLFGGVGRVSGIVAGVLILGTVNSLINLSGTSPYLQGTLKGSIILLAVALSQFRLQHLWRRQPRASTASPMEGRTA